MEMSEKDRQEILKLYREFLDAENKFFNRLIHFYSKDKDMAQADLFLSESILHLEEKLREKGILKEGE